MTQQYIRAARLLLGSDAGQQLELSDLRFAFVVERGDLATPNTCDIRVTNVAPATIAKAEKEFTKLVLMAGYEDGGPSVIFQGTIKQRRSGRSSQVDTHLDINAADGDMAINFGVVSQTLAAGYSNADVHKAICTKMNPLGVTPGYTAPLPGPVYPRGRVLYGMARDHANTLARGTDTIWSVQDGKLQFVPRDQGFVPGQAVVLNAATGMIGLPEQTEGGIYVRCLLNPRIVPGRIVQIDQASVQRARQDPSNTPQAALANKLIPNVAADGFYRTLLVSHVGDTRGNDWYTALVCVALSDSTPLSQVRRGVIDQYYQSQ